MTESGKIFQLHLANVKHPHIFEKGTVPNNIFAIISEYDDPEGDIPVVDHRVRHLIDFSLLKGKPYEDEVREMIGLPPRKIKETE